MKKSRIWSAFKRTMTESYRQVGEEHGYILRPKFIVTEDVGSAWEDAIIETATAKESNEA